VECVKHGDKKFGMINIVTAALIFVVLVALFVYD